MTTDQPPISAVEAVRCFFLARELELKGEIEAAEKWKRRGQDWFDQHRNAKIDEDLGPSPF